MVVFTMVFPNSQQPLHGIFVRERVRHLAEIADVRVVAPVPWYCALGHRIAPLEPAPAMPVSHPRFWYIPKVLKSCRGILLAVSVLPEIRRLRKNFDFDLIDAHFAYPDGFAAVLLGRWFQRPVCITLRGTIVQWSRRRTGRLLCDWGMQNAARIIAVAETLAERAREGGVSPNRIATIPNGVDAGRFRLIERAVARKELALPIDGKLLVSVGHISPRKGFHRIIRALPRVIRCSPDVHLAIVGGKGAEEDNTLQLHALAKRLGLWERVSFIGPKPPDQVALWLAAADVFVLASDFEGCPNVVLEAMACGRPVVATKVGDVERMVPDFAGILFDDAEDEVTVSQSIVAALGRDWDAHRIRDHVATASWDAVARGVTRQWLFAIDEASRRDPAAATTMRTAAHD